MEEKDVERGSCMGGFGVIYKGRVWKDHMKIIREENEFGII